MWGIKKGEPLEVSVTGESIQPRGLRECKECCHGERGVLKGCLEQSAWNLEEENLETVTGEEVVKCGNERYLAFHSAESQFLGMLSGSGLGKLPLYRTRQ